MNTSTHPSERRLISGLALLVLTTATSAFAGEAPAISPKHALELAEQALAEKGAAGEVYVQSLALEHTSLLEKKMVWSVTWSHSLPGSTAQKKEVGIEIHMDGSIVHLVKGPVEATVKHGPR